MTRVLASITLMGVLALASVAIAGEKTMDHSGHGAMEHEVSTPGEVKPGTVADGVGIINSVDAEKKMINITHEPMPELNWPTMTMDLPVTRRVDLGRVQAGDKVGFELKLGRDKKYRVIGITPAD